MYSIFRTHNLLGMSLNAAFNNHFVFLLHRLLTQIATIVVIVIIIIITAIFIEHCALTAVLTIYKNYLVSFYQELVK